MYQDTFNCHRLYSVKRYSFGSKGHINRSKKKLKSGSESQRTRKVIYIINKKSNIATDNIRQQNNAAPCENMSLGICGHQRSRSACASKLSAQDLTV